MLDVILLAHAVGEDVDEGSNDVDGSRDGNWLMLGDNDGTDEIANEGDWLVLGVDDGDVVGTVESEGLTVSIAGMQS